MSERTITANPGTADVASGSRTHTSLVFITDAEDPQTMSSSHALDDIDKVSFRRGERGVERSKRSLTLSFPDRRMSTLHGSLELRDGRWVLDDPESKNPAIVDGAFARRSVLVNGSVFELGHSFFLFRETTVERAPPAHLSGDTDAAHLPAWPAGLETFSPALAWQYDDLMTLASNPVSIVVTGETGTGKEVVARAIHAASKRPGLFVGVNCGALAPNLVESELFGHRRGAFSGAVADRRGLIRSADKGTLFLDEIGELPPAAQASLLRVLQERTVLPIGEDCPIAVDLRVVAATLRDLPAARERGEFRADLYARLSGHVATTLPLRDRREDFGLLFAAMLRPTPSVRFTPAAIRTLLSHDWPNNIRELEQALSTSIALAQGAAVDRVHLPATVRRPRAAEPADRVPVDLDEADRTLRANLVALLDAHGGNVAAVAAALGKQRAQIYKWVTRLAIDLEPFRR